MPSWSQTIAELRRGELEARDRVVRLAIGTLRALGAYAQRDSWDDLVQDVLVTLLDDAPRSLDDAAVATWIRRVTTHRYLDHVRKEHGRRRVTGEASAGWRRSVPLAVELPLDEVAVDERLQHDLATALARLDPRVRRILECKYALGCTDAEGAAQLDEALGTYKRLLRQGLAELRGALLEHGESKSGAGPPKEA